MDKNAIKKYAVWARRELISRVSQRAALYGITDQGFGDINTTSVNGIVLNDIEIKQRQALILQIKSKGYEQVMEEVAYTWFNRFIALRFMEVNGYLPSRVRVFTNDDNEFKPEILSEAINLEFCGFDMEKVFALKNANDNDELFKYLIIVQCNELNSILPGMFQKIADYTELLFPDNLLREGSTVEQMVSLIPEDDWQDQVQIIGWLYQYYNIEKKEEVFAALKKNIKITKENIPAATQLFTPDWIVRYMVENSLGRLWLEGHPNDGLKSEWKYYLDEMEQQPQVQTEIAVIRKDYAALTPNQIKCIDPCSGSGHICAYMFDVLMQIYEAYGYTAREAVASIVENNIYGLDIDERATQLAYFAVMMKARQYDRRFFSRGIQPHVYAVQQSNDLDRYTLDYFCDGRHVLKETMQILCDEMRDAKEYGSIVNVSQVNFNALYDRIDEIRKDISIYKETVLVQLLPFIECAEAIAQKYDVVITNPPYMAISSASAKLNEYINKNYLGGKTDLFSAFIERCLIMAKDNKYVSMITMQSWMFLTSFEKLRKKVLSYEILSMAHMGARGFDEISGEVVQTTAFVIQKSSLGGEYMGWYSRLIDGMSEREKSDMFLQKKMLFKNKSSNFKKIPQLLIAYWVSNSTIDCFGQKTLSSVFTTREGMATADNNRFLRIWTEVDFSRVTLDCRSAQDGIDRKIKWVPYNKGGTTRDWYGNNDYVVDWENDGFDIRNNRDEKTGRIRSHNYNGEYGFKEGLTWSAISSSDLSVRYCKTGFLFDSKGAKGFANKDNNIYWILGLLNSKVSMQFLQFISPTLDFKVGDIISIPYITDKSNENRIIQLSKEIVQIAKTEWDSFEASWDFEEHPLIRISKDLCNETVVGKSRKYYNGENLESFCTIEIAYLLWKNECDERFNSVKEKEEELNKLFIDMYNLRDEISPEVTADSITIRKADLKREIKSLISYAVGCMFGRYSLNTPGLAFAGGSWDSTKYTLYDVDVDNIIPICNDEYFEDDIVGRFIDFIVTVFGDEGLEDNLKFIAGVLGGKGQPREVIRNYFLNEFYSDHCNMYAVTGSGKRPIYWLFDSGKKNGFKALIYMHRYQPDTLARIRTDYVHEQQSRYRTIKEDLENRISGATASERVKLNKQLKKVSEQETELLKYEEKIHHLADQMISIDLDDGVKVNYAKFQDVLAKIK